MTSLSSPADPVAIFLRSGLPAVGQAILVLFSTGAASLGALDMDLAITQYTPPGARTAVHTPKIQTNGRPKHAERFSRKLARSRCQ